MQQFAFAQEKLTDKVVIRDAKTGRNITYTCQIVDYTGRTISIRFRNNIVRNYPAGQVVDIDSPKTKPHIDGMTAYSNGEYKTAESFLERAFTTETRTWMRREILASLVRCGYHQGDYFSVAVRVMSIASSDPATQHFYLIPLKWSESFTDRSMKREATRWLTDPQQGAQLIGASFLLFDPVQNEKAVSVLKKLSFSGNSQLRDLATAQLWRIRLKENKLFPDEVDGWREVVDSMPGKMRGGPYFLLGLGYEKLHRQEEAAIAFLRMPLLFDFDRYQSAEALLKAAEILARSRKPASAKLLYREIGARFPETPAAKIASRSLENLRTSERATHRKESRAKDPSQ